MRARLFEGVADFDGLVLEPAGAADRALGLWESGVAMTRLDDGRVLLTWPRPRRLRAEAAPGLPVRRHGSGFVDHCGDTPVQPGTVRVLVGGTIAELRLTDRVDPGSLLELDGWGVIESHSPPGPDGSPLEPAAPSAGHPRAPEPEIAAAEAVETRSALGVPEADEATRRAWEQLAQRVPPPPTLDRRVGSPGAGAVAGGAAGGAPSPSILDRLRSRLAEWFGGDPRQEKWLRDLERRFAEGDLDEALRRAVPFGGDGERLGWGMPGRRDALMPSSARGGGGGSMRIEPSLRQQLHRHYEAAFEQLDRAGRTREAAFVVIDLLDQPDRGCTYLEERGELALAADIAEGRANDPGLAVRLLWNAGERDRAVTVARRHRAFAAAIARCERAGDRETGKALRREWSSRLLAGGDLIGAYDTLGPCDDPVSAAIRERTLELGLATDGHVHTRMTARAVRAQRPDAVDHVVKVIAESEDGPRRGGSHIDLLVDELGVRSPAPLDPVAIRPLVNRLIEIEGGANSRTRTIVKRSGDRVLRADLPSQEGPKRKQPLLPVEVVLEPDDRGVIPVLDARALRDGSTVAVLADIGIRVFRPDGRPRTDIDLLCDFVVPADHGASVIACRRLDAGSVSAWLVHLTDGTRQYLGEVRTSVHASTFDGSRWFVGHHATLWMLDILAEGPTALWAQTDLGGTIVGLARSTMQLAVAAYRGDADDDRVTADAFVFRLPRLLGVGMRPVTVTPGAELLDDGTTMFGVVAHDDAHVVVAQPDGDRMILSCRARRGTRSAPIAIVELPAADPSVFVDNGFLIVADGAGRIERINLRTRERLAPIRTLP